MLTFAVALTHVLALAAPTPAERIARGEAAMASLEYELAADELSLAASDEGATDAQRLHASLQAGIASVIINRADMARVHFRYVLLRAPSTTLPSDTPQKVSSFFALIRNELAAERAASPQKAVDDDDAHDHHHASPSPATPAPAEPVSAVEERSSMLPLAVSGVGLAVALGGAGVTTLAEVALGDAALPRDDRGGWLNAGRVGLIVASVGVVVAATGGVLAVVE